METWESISEKKYKQLLDKGKPREITFGVTPNFQTRIQHETTQS